MQWPIPPSSSLHLFGGRAAKRPRLKTLSPSAETGRVRPGGRQDTMSMGIGGWAKISTKSFFVKNKIRKNGDQEWGGMQYEGVGVGSAGRGHCEISPLRGEGRGAADPRAHPRPPSPPHRPDGPGGPGGPRHQLLRRQGPRPGLPWWARAPPPPACQPAADSQPAFFFGLRSRFLFLG